MLNTLKKYVPNFIREKTERLFGRHVYCKAYDQLECIYIHIPKTAGSSIGTSLFATSTPGHWTAETYLWTNRIKFKKYYKFTVVRNPWDRLASAYFYLKAGGKNKSDSEWAKNNLSEFKSFEDFIKTGLHQKHIIGWVHFKPQYKFLELTNKKIGLDYIGRFENLQEDFNTIANHLEVKAVLPHTNQSERPSYKDLYSQETIRIVANIYQKDISLFDYEF